MQIKPFKAGDAPPDNDWAKNIERSLDDFFIQLVTIINNGIREVDNFDMADKTVTTSGVPGTEVAVAHGLKRTPKGFRVYSQDRAGSLYDGVTANNSTNIYIRSDVASVIAKVFIF